MGGISAVFGLVNYLGFKLSILLFWTIALVSAHVLANRWGSRMGSRRAVDADTADRPSRLPERGQVPRQAFAPSTLLSDESRLDRAVTYGAMMGSALGILAGGAGLGWLYAQRQVWVALAFGTLAAGVLGAILGGLSMSMAQVALRAWREAVAASALDRPRLPTPPPAATPRPGGTIRPSANWRFRWWQRSR